MLRFVLTFVILMGAFELAGAMSFVRDTVFPSYLRFNARLSGALLGLVENNVTVHGNSIRGRYPLTIERGCDAIEPSALFLSGVLAFPATIWAKVPGMLLGTLCLMMINVIRIISLFYVGVYYPKLFHVAHVDVWQSLFVFLAILFWILWALWATRDKVVIADAGAQAH